MASLIQGFEYDIFISYRKNDNKYDGWVTEFVTNLKKELEATIKDNLSTYFDENQQDGLLETDIVDKSLNGKLKSLIFIPILSQTYCDPKSYAWQNEFLAFNNMVKEDSLGRDIILRNGNVASRILSVRIHDLDANDLSELQNITGGPLRAIDFYYKESGVNRPLKPEDNEDKNFNKTKYRNQVNKVANSIKEILISIRTPRKLSIPSPEKYPDSVSTASKSIAVLPFVNMTNDPEQEYLSDGISEEIINTLVLIPDLKVAGRTSSFSFKNRNEDLRSICEMLNVNTILEGSVRKSGNRIRISVQLIEAATGFNLWSEKFDKELNDVFVIQDEIARAIVDKLQVTIAEKASSPKERKQTNNVEAYQLYLKGMSFFYKRGPHIFDGLKCFEDALKIDPDYALALAGIAESYSMLCFQSYLSPEEAWPKASEAANHGILVGSGLAEVHSAFATISLLFERNWVKAEMEYLNAIEINPGYLPARSWYSRFCLQVLRQNNDEALKHAHLAVQHDLLSSFAQTIVSFVASSAGLFDEGLAAGRKSVELDKESFTAWYYLGYSNHCAGNIASAISAYKHAIDISGRHSWALTSLLSILMEPSEYQQVQEANTLYRELLTKAKMGYVSPFLLAVASAALGKIEDAIRYIDESLTRHDPLFITNVHNRPDNKALRAIPEFREMTKEFLLH